MGIKNNNNLILASSLMLTNILAKNNPNNKKNGIGIDVKSNDDDDNHNFNLRGVDCTNHIENMGQGKGVSYAMNRLLKDKFIISMDNGEADSENYIQQQMNMAKESKKDIIVIGCGLPYSDINIRVIKALSENNMKATIIFEDINKSIKQKEMEYLMSGAKGVSENDSYTPLILEKSQLYNEPIKFTNNRKDYNKAFDEPISKNRPQMMSSVKKRKKKAKNGRTNKK